MKFRVGDKVRIVRDLSGCNPHSIGQVGVITGLTWRDDYPYDVSTVNGEYICVCCDAELESLDQTTLVSDESTVVASGRITFDALAVCAPIVVGDKRLDEVLREYADSGEDVEIVVRRKERG